MQDAAGPKSHTNNTCCSKHTPYRSPPLNNSPRRGASLCLVAYILPPSAASVPPSAYGCLKKLHQSEPAALAAIRLTIRDSRHITQGTPKSRRFSIVSTEERKKRAREKSTRWHTQAPCRVYPTRVHGSRCLLAVSCSSLVRRCCSSNAGPYFGKIKGGRNATTAQVKIPVVGDRGGGAGNHCR